MSGVLAARTHLVPRRFAAGLRWYAVAWVYLGCFVVVEVVYGRLDPHAQAAFVAWASTSVVNLEHDPVGCLVVSAFVTGGTGWGALTWVPLIAIALFGAVNAVGGWRAAVVCAAGHVVGTLISEGVVAWRVSSGALPPAYRYLTDVGPSYVVVSAVVVALLCGSRRWRLLAAADLLVLLFVVRIFSGLMHLDVAAVGHLTAIVTAAAGTYSIARLSMLQRHRSRN
jgi:hypothetical protein